MLHKDRHQFRPPAAGVIGDPQQRRVAQAKLVAAAGLEQMRETHSRSRAIKIGDVALEPDRARLALAHAKALARRLLLRSEEHTTELQSLMRISFCVFCLKKNNSINTTISFCDRILMQ